MTTALVEPSSGSSALGDETSAVTPSCGFAKTKVIALTSMTAATGLLCLPVHGSSDFATSSHVLYEARQPGWTPDLWSPATLATAANVGADSVPTDQEEIRWVKDNSGLTWDQLGKIFGVSRRAVHLWANGGRMNEANSRTLHDFGAEVRGVLRESPDATRTALLAHSAGSLSIVERFRTRSVVPAGKSWGAPFTVDEKVEESAMTLDRDL